MYEEGGGTLPRQQRGILQRAVLNTMPPLEHHHYMNAAAAAEYVCHAGGLGPPTANVAPGTAGVASNVVGAGNVLDSSSLTNVSLTIISINLTFFVYKIAFTNNFSLTPYSPI